MEKFELIEKWRESHFIGQPYIMEADKQALVDSGKIDLFQEFQKSKGNAFDSELLHFGLLPNPYGGDIVNAQIYILMLNPGYNEFEHEYEDSNPDFRKAIIKTIRQENHKDEYPFVSLNHEFYKHPGYGYFANKLIGQEFKGIRKRKFLHTASFIVDNKIDGIVSLQDAFKFLSKRVAVLEYFPYHSSKYHFDNLAKQMTSCRLISEFVASHVVRKTEYDDAVIICMRKNLWWDLKPNTNILIYDQPNEALTASLTQNSRGGKLIMEFLLRHYPHQ